MRVSILSFVFWFAFQPLVLAHAQDRLFSHLSSEELAAIIAQYDEQMAFMNTTVESGHLVIQPGMDSTFLRTLRLGGVSLILGGTAILVHNTVGPRHRTLVHAFNDLDPAGPNGQEFMQRSLDLAVAEQHSSGLLDTVRYRVGLGNIFAMLLILGAALSIGTGIDLPRSGTTINLSTEERGQFLELHHRLALKRAEYARELDLRRSVGEVVY